MLEPEPAADGAAPSLTAGGLKAALSSPPANAKTPPSGRQTVRILCLRASKTR